MTQPTQVATRSTADVPFSHRAVDEDRPMHCLVCWGYGGTITRHRGRPQVPEQAPPGSSS